MIDGVKHVTVCHREGRYAGWPANHGIWSWGNEILVGFSLGYHAERRGFHQIDHHKPEEHLLARSLDGGESWEIENPASQGQLIPSGDALHGSPPHPCPFSIPPVALNFGNPDFCMTARMTSLRRGRSHLYASDDRGRHWHGPYALPLFGQTGVAARTDYRILDESTAVLCLTAAKPNGREGRPFTACTRDAGLTWDFVSWIEESTKPGFAIMPSTIAEGPRALTAIRHQYGKRNWISLYSTVDNYESWRNLPHTFIDTGRGSPGSLLYVDDHKALLTYCYRSTPSSIWCQKISTSGDLGPVLYRAPYAIRRGGGSHDVGYPVSVMRPDGKVVAVYYFHDSLDSERYIEAAIFDPE